MKFRIDHHRASRTHRLRDPFPISTPGLPVLLVRAASEGIFSYHFLISRIGSRLGKSRGERRTEKKRAEATEKGIGCKERKKERGRKRWSRGGCEYLGVQRIVEKERARYLAGGR